MLEALLTRKYGEFVTNNLLNSDKEVLVNHYNRDDPFHQQKVMNHILDMKDEKGTPLFPANFKLNDVEWGMDFSGWLGTIENPKDFLFIGAEPHIWKNYQVVYGFGTNEEEEIHATALKYAKDNKDIWHYILKNFLNDSSDSAKVEFLKKCYITDLCHVVPKSCGTVDSICKKLAITKKEWHFFRTSVARNFLIKEIESVKPKFVVLHGSVARDFFQHELGVEFNTKFQIADWNRYIRLGTLNNFKVLAIPHLKGQLLNELWRSKKHPERPEAAKRIIQEIIARQHLAE